MRQIRRMFVMKMKARFFKLSVVLAVVNAVLLAAPFPKAYSSQSVDVFSSLEDVSQPISSDEHTQREYLEKRYGVQAEEIQFTPHEGYPIIVRGGDEKSFFPTLDPHEPAIKEIMAYDVVVIGAGPAGLTAALYLLEEGKRVLILEKEKAIGGLAAAGEKKGIRYGRGAAYMAEPNESEYSILKHIGLADYEKLEIQEPIDSYLWEGKLYKGVWEEDTLAELPASFSLFKRALELTDEDLISDQPMEMGPDLSLDRITAADFIRRMPKALAQQTDATSKKIMDWFQKDPKVDVNDPMIEVIHFLNLYSRSALGTTLNNVSGLAFANFFASEIDTRYTGQYGTGDVVSALKKRLSEFPQLLTIKTLAPVAKLISDPNSVTVTYVQDGLAFEAKAEAAVFAAPLNVASKVIDRFPEIAPEHHRLIENMQYAHYSVHNVFVKGHVFRDSYDTWLRASDPLDTDPTDFIIGRYQDPNINGYLGMRNFESNPVDDYGIITIYHPLPLAEVGKGYRDEVSILAAENATKRIEQQLGPLVKAAGLDLKIELIETNRWPYSIHIASPGHIEKAAPLLTIPVNRIYFASNNLGVPSVEEALYRGKVSAEQILEALKNQMLYLGGVVLETPKLSMAESISGDCFPLYCRSSSVLAAAVVISSRLTDKYSEYRLEAISAARPFP